MSLRDLRRHVGQLAIVGFPGHTVPGDLKKVAEEFDLGGVIYFARNVAEPAQVAEMSREAAAMAQDWPLWISVDQEGGRVARLRRPFTEWPPMATLGRTDEASLIEAFGVALATELRAVGINFDFTPVLDILTNEKNPVIGDRAFGSTADVVSRVGVALIDVLHREGIVACGKHFPGHGDTSVDSHHELPMVEHDPERLRAVECAPFVAAMKAGVQAIMTAHILVPSLDEDVPATMSRRIVTGILKGELGFDGMVVSDDLGMNAVAATWPTPEAMVASLEAGCDVVLLCNSTLDDQVAAFEAVIRAAESGRLSQTRIDDALARQRRVKTRFAPIMRPGPFDASAIGRDHHQHTAHRLAALL
ncbi:MAG: beta-N-acetylhexosaminidase [Vicinamibacterales bacterium]